MDVTQPVCLQESVENVGCVSLQISAEKVPSACLQHSANKWRGGVCVRGVFGILIAIAVLVQALVWLSCWPSVVPDTDGVVATMAFAALNTVPLQELNSGLGSTNGGGSVAGGPVTGGASTQPAYLQPAGAATPLGQITQPQGPSA